MKHIRILSPAGAIDHDYIIQAKNRLKSWGFHVSLSANAFGEHGRFSGTAQERLSDLNDAFADESVDIILCARGGYGLQQIVDKIVLPTRPKDQWPLVVGFSDITALHALMSLHGVPSLHASMCKALATLPDESEALQLLHQALDGDWVMEMPIAKGKKIIGGNLSVLYGLQGTPYSLNAIIDQCEEAPVLLIEDICERHYHVDRMLNNLRMSGVLGRLGGVIIGQFTDCDNDPRMQCTLQDSIREILADYDYPIIWDAPYGHIDENRPIMLSQTT
jgi:muramoyltetrapeptide carboxypeptidase